MSAAKPNRVGSEHTVERRRHKLDLDLVVGGVLRLGGAQGSLDGVDAFVTEAGDCAY
jgi:hypothetical protein